MELHLREARAEDAEPCGRICYAAFTRINAEHGFPPDFPNADVAIGFLRLMIGHPEIHVVVAERDGRIVGSNGVDERGPIAGVGPITVEPGVQNGGVGRRLMEYVLAREAGRRLAGVRLVQAAFHNRSLSLYAKLGFDAREPLSCIQGTPLRLTLPGHRVRPAALDDLDACDQLCLRVHGHVRTGEVRDAVTMRGAMVVERNDRITGYTTGIAFFGHSVAEQTSDLQALIAAAPEFGGPGFLLPTRHAELFRWCLAHGLQVVEPMTLMTLGLYSEPAGAYLPSIAY